MVAGHTVGLVAAELEVERADFAEAGMHIAGVVGSCLLAEVDSRPAGARLVDNLDCMAVAAASRNLVVVVVLTFSVTKTNPNWILYVC